MPAFIAAALVLLGLGWIAERYISTPRHKGEPSDHFTGKKFINLDPKKRRKRSAIERIFSGKKGLWERTLEHEPQEAPPERVEGDNLRVTYVGQATVLVQYQGVNILTDPIWSHRSGPLPWLGAHRARPAGIRYEDLPPIDVVLVSHNHYDHMDIPTLKDLEKDFSPIYLVPVGDRKFLNNQGIERVFELSWGEKFEYQSLRFWGTPARHWSGRGMFDRNTSHWLSFVIESAAGKVYFAGDTAYGTHFKSIGETHGSFRVALLPIGAYLPLEYMADVHMSPQDAVQAHDDLNSEFSIGIHYGTFKIAHEGQYEPVDTLKDYLDTFEHPINFTALGFGEGREIRGSRA